MATQGQRLDPSGRRVEGNQVEGSQVETRYFDPSGSQLATREAAQAAAQAFALPGNAAQATAYLELRSGGASFTIEVTLRLDAYPFHVIGGTIERGICGGPWSVTSESLIGSHLQLEGKRMGSGKCADTIAVVGEFQNPSSWTGTYTFDGSPITNQHTTLFLGWDFCP